MLLVVKGNGEWEGREGGGGAGGAPRGRYLAGSVVRANKVDTALKGGITPPRSTASITSKALRRTCTGSANSVWPHKSSRFQ